MRCLMHFYKKQDDMELSSNGWIINLLFLAMSEIFIIIIII